MQTEFRMRWPFANRRRRLHSSPVHRNIELMALDRPHTNNSTGPNATMGQATQGFPRGQELPPHRGLIPWSSTAVHQVLSKGALRRSDRTARHARFIQSIVDVQPNVCFAHQSCFKHFDAGPAWVLPRRERVRTLTCPGVPSGGVRASSAGPA